MLTSKSKKKYALLAVGLVLGVAASFFLSTVVLHDTDPYEHLLFGWALSAFTGLVVFWTTLFIVLVSKE